MRHQNPIAMMLALTLALAPATAARAASAQARPSPRRERGTAKYEVWLQKQVRHELLMLPYYSVFDNLEYRISGDTVTLSGQVTRPTLKSDAGNVVKRIEGVRRVNNQIEVLPLSPNDDRIRLATYRAIYSAPQLQRYSIQPVPSVHIIVKRGHVMLVGVVDSEADRNVANIRANSVPGVFSVTNRLVVEK